MADANISIVGNMTRDPELRFAASGTAIAQLGVAVNYRRMNRQTNEWDEETSFFDVTCFGQMAENVGESLTKGTRIVVTGRLQQRSWENDNGERRSKVEIVADEVAPSLRWATVSVQKAERSSGGGAPSGGGRPVQNQPAPSSGGPFDDTEEPF